MTTWTSTARTTRGRCPPGGQRPSRSSWWTGRVTEAATRPPAPSSAGSATGPGLPSGPSDSPRKSSASPPSHSASSSSRGRPTITSVSAPGAPRAPRWAHGVLGAGPGV
ncbi:hypothetical protein RLOC_00007003 [Lonchura striata]|uniref:Uncharacterized protein n=1 Tax=Lonchura striata TaxID=40157 RepID=A0A218UMR3_9PASE|nr:hypothetical protein RLOC_00007003 [Lonchura striata domestica]